MKSRFFGLLAIAALGVVIADGWVMATCQCPWTVFRECRCPAACEDSYCETACVLIDCQVIDGRESCPRRCDGRSCYAYGQNACEPLGLVVLFAPFLGIAAAEESSGIHLEKGDRLFRNQDGEFLITEPVPGMEPVGSVGVRVVSAKGVLRVVGVSEGGAAAKAGVKVGDLIVSIDGRAVDKMPLEDAVKSLRGKPGTSVTVRVKKKTGARPAKVSLVRASDAGPRPDTGIAMKHVTLQDLKAARCPKTSDECNFLYEEKGTCVFTCKKDQGK